MRFSKFLTITAALIASIGIATSAMAKGNGKNPGMDSIYEIASTTAGFEVLTALIDLAGLDETLTNDGQFTVFAPTNDGFPFSTVPGGVEFLAETCETDDPEVIGAALMNILYHHVRDGRRFSGSILAGNGPKSLEMLNGYIWVDDDLSIMTGSGGESAIDDSLFDVNASNGVIHAIEAVMLPADVCAVPEEA